MHSKYTSSVYAAYESGLRTAKCVAEAKAARIAIVGPGINGLAAAHRLTNQGLEVIVLEAA
ncbi:MAG: NAD(P)-binding protein [Cyanobacteria bacterium J06638_28]